MNALANRYKAQPTAAARYIRCWMLNHQRQRKSRNQRAGKKKNAAAATKCLLQHKSVSLYFFFFYSSQPATLFLAETAFTNPTACHHSSSSPLVLHRTHLSKFYIFFFSFYFALFGYSFIASSKLWIMWIGIGFHYPHCLWECFRRKQTWNPGLTNLFITY